MVSPRAAFAGKRAASAASAAHRKARSGRRLRAKRVILREPAESGALPFQRSFSPGRTPEAARGPGAPRGLRPRAPSLLALPRHVFVRALLKDGDREDRVARVEPVDGVHPRYDRRKDRVGALAAPRAPRGH